MPPDRKKAAAAKLVNLAIASTVVTIRKAFSEWAGSSVVASASSDVGWSKREDFGIFGRYDDFKALPVVPQARFAMSRFMEPTIQGKLVPRMAVLKRLVEQLNSGATSEAHFKPNLNAEVENLARALTENPDVFKERDASPVRIPGLGPVQPEPPRFRLPSVKERENFP